ncbi:MAG: hypothetical protein AABZ15_17025 [Nitrospirota bacterium]
MRYLAFHTLLLISLSAIAAPSTASGDTGRGYLELGGGYKTGAFGTPTRSSLYYLSSTIGYVAPRYDASVTVPYLFIESRTGSQSQTESGVGDMILRVGRVLVPGGDSGLSLDGALAVKVPTADEMKGLGTGETDYGSFMGLHQRLGRFKVSFNGGYIKVGDPPRINYNDIYLYAVGISRIFGDTDLYTSFEGRRAVVPGTKNPQEINVGFFHVMNADYAIKGGAFSGLNNGGPDFGINLGIVRWF